MISWFNAREPRERVLLLILAGLIVLFMAWFAISRERGPDGASALEAAQTDRELWLRAAPRLGSTAIAGGNAASISRVWSLNPAAVWLFGLTTRRHPRFMVGLKIW